MEPETEDAIRELAAPQSPKRRSAAKRLRRVRDSAAGPALLAALEKEVQNSRTWETQYQLVMAVGECGYTASLLTLERLAVAEFEATMVYVALGDAIVRLARVNDHDVAPVLKILRHSKNTGLMDGSLRAMAMLRMVPEPDAMREILAFMKPLIPTDPLRFWVAAAAPGWKHPDLEGFLAACATSGRRDVAEAGDLARLGKYKKWNPL